MKSKKVLYLAVSLFWAGLLLSAHPCSLNAIPAFEIWLVSITSLFFSLAWHSSYKRDIKPNKVKSIVRLLALGLLETFKLIIVFIALSLPLIILMPSYSCYTDRALNSESMSVLNDAKLTIAKKILNKKQHLNDYSNILPPHHGRLVYFSVTGEGKILAHYSEPGFSVYLTPKLINGKVEWSCKAFPPKVSPSVCR